LSAETSALLKALAAAREDLRSTPATDPAHAERKREWDRLRMRYRAARQREDAHRVRHGYDPGTLLGWSVTRSSVRRRFRPGLLSLRWTGVEHAGEAEGRSRLPDFAAETNRANAKVGGGGGSRTRVREYAVAGPYMRSRSWMFAAAVKERRKPAAASSEKSRRHASEPPVATSLLLWHPVPPYRRGRGGRRCL